MFLGRPIFFADSGYVRVRLCTCSDITTTVFNTKLKCY